MKNNNEEVKNTLNNLEKENTKNEQSNIKGEKKNKKKLWIILSITIVIVIAGIIIYTRISKDDCTNNVINPRPSSSGSNFYPSSGMTDDKPIIYLYPEQKVQVSVKLGKPENITCSYPKYDNGWNVIANPDGTIFDVETGRELYSLYWEGMHSEKVNLEEGFIVKGSETIEFLEEKLEILGLNDKEAEEFIIYWLPILQKSEYNYIRFATLEEINNNMPLEFSVEPDTLIRVLMQYKTLDEYIEVQEQKLVTPERKGFVVVEWGGTEIK